MNPMSRKDAILSMRQVLVKRRDALRKALAGDLSLLKELRAQTSGDMVDAALDSVQDEISSQLAEVESRELTRIEYALERMRTGQFGICEGCNTGIPMARLNALPYATYCIKCQREAERARGRRRQLRRRRLEPSAGFVRRRRRPLDQRHRAGRFLGCPTERASGLKAGRTGKPGFVWHPQAINHRIRHGGDCLSVPGAGYIRNRDAPGDLAPFQVVARAGAIAGTVLLAAGLLLCVAPLQAAKNATGGAQHPVTSPEERAALQRIHRSERPRAGGPGRGGQDRGEAPRSDGRPHRGRRAAARLDAYRKTPAVGGVRLRSDRPAERPLLRAH